MFRRNAPENFFRGTGLPTVMRKNQPLVPWSNFGGKVCARTARWFCGQTLPVPGHGGGGTQTFGSQTPPPPVTHTPATALSAWPIPQPFAHASQVAQPPVQEEPAEPQRFIRGFTDLHEADAVLEDEVGTAHDYEQLGRYVGQLLTRRHYRWVSHRQSVYAMLDQLLPELSTDTPEHMADLQRLMKHATDMQRNFTKIDSRPF